LQSSKNDELGKYDFITAADEWKKHSTYSHDTEALVYAVSAGGSLGKSQYVKGKFMCSNLCSVLTKKKESKYQVNMRFYNAYLNHIREEIVDSLADGTSKLTLKNDELEDYYVEYIPINVQNKYVEENLKKYDEQKEKLRTIEEEIEENLEEIIRKLQSN
jgi:type I restriction enzyme M protein